MEARAWHHAERIQISSLLFRLGRGWLGKSSPGMQREWRCRRIWLIGRLLSRLRIPFCGNEDEKKKKELDVPNESISIIKAQGTGKILSKSPLHLIINVCQKVLRFFKIQVSFVSKCEECSECLSTVFYSWIKHRTVKGWRISDSPLIVLPTLVGLPARGRWFDGSLIPPTGAMTRPLDF